MIHPTYYVRHPDGSYTEADPQPAPKQEPFGYVSEHNCQGPFQYQFHKESATVYTDNCKSITPVFTQPYSGSSTAHVDPFVQVQERKPLTDEEICLIGAQVHGFLLCNEGQWGIEMARAIEAAHGIKEQP